MKNYTNRSLFIFMLFITYTAYSQSGPKLNSFPTAAGTVYLDFDGQTVKAAAWNGGAQFVCAASGMNDTQITEIYERVAEDYRPFNIKVTTDLAVFTAAPLKQRIRVIITPTSSWYYAGVGGVAYIGSFTWGDDTPAFVFADRLFSVPKYLAECCSHESGHTVGLSHQSAYDGSCNLTQTYSTGAGTGEIGWAPIMGNSYGANMTGWNNGPTPNGCNSTQDNLSIITSQNGFTYRTDDYSDLINTSNFDLGTSSFNVSGVISTFSDKDAFKFVNNLTSQIHLEVNPASVNISNTGADLDVQMDLYDGSKTLIRSYNPPTLLNVVADTTLNAGTYYIVVSSIGNVNAANYSSLGSYTLSGVKALLPIHDVSLSGSSDKTKHNLRWKIIADEPIKTQVLEVSLDGATFRPLTTMNSAPSAFSYAPYDNATVYYRLKVTSVRDQEIYSNIIALKATEKQNKLFNVSTFVREEVSINASENYQYILSDLSGRTLRGGQGIKGINKINIQNQPAGMYVIQIINNNTTQTERIIKQ
ncbi:MAG: T9SS type A sorting domain-containing protein [Ferruginibacter sp.]